jgi:2-octaprenyl-6-methoxyphenol hydroxylase
MTQNFDITIIGGSFAGMTAALALAQISPELKVAVIEKQDILRHDRKRDGRAYAISSASLKLFREIGIFDETNENAGKISDIKITDHKSPFFLDFLGREVDPQNSELGQVIENYHIHNALRNQILRCKNITVFAPNFYQEIEFLNDGPRHEDGVTSWNEEGVIASVESSHTVTPHSLRGPGQTSHGVRIKLNDGKIINSKLLLACDGRISRLRELYQIPTTRKNYNQTAIVFNISHKKPHENLAYEKFFPGGPLAILPFKNQHESSIVWIAPDQQAEAILALDEENFLQQLSKKMEGDLGEVKIISEKFSYPLILIEAERFYHQKMLLIGDAACGVHPIAGQGFNLAIAGIKILRDLIKNNLFCGFDIGRSALIESYDKKAKFEAKKMLIATDLLNSLFENKSLSLGLARDFGLGIVNKIPTLKKYFIKSAGGF